MSIVLKPLSLPALRSLARSKVPDDIIGVIADGALPPAFVAERALAHLADGKSPYWCSTYLIATTSDGAIVGGCGFKGEPCHGRVEIGYAVSPACRNRGTATSAVKELVRIAFQSVDVHEVLAVIDPANEASMCVVRKLDFEYSHLQTELDGSGVQWVLRNRSNKSFQRTPAGVAE